MAHKLWAISIIKTSTVKFKIKILGKDEIFEKWGIGTREVSLWDLTSD